MDATNGIKLIDVHFQYQNMAPILEEITLSIRPGEFVGIVGANGSGKTTLARLLNGSLQPTSGRLLVDGLEGHRSEKRLAISRLVALITSDAESQFVTSTVFDEVAFCLQALRLSRDEIILRTDIALDLFDLAQYRHVHPFYLSIGEQARLLLAANLVRQPRYLILDEVTSMMDSHTRHMLWSYLLDERDQRGCSIILLTHRLDDLLQADRIIVLQQGKIVLDDSVERAFAQALDNPSWKIEVPLIYQLSQLLPPSHQADFPELFPLKIK